MQMKCFVLLKASRGRPESDYISDKYPTLTKNIAAYQGKPKNIVILLQESLGAQFIGTLGGKTTFSKCGSARKRRVVI